MKMKPPSGPKKTNPKQTQNKPKTNPIQSQSNPILEAMFVNFYATVYYESKPTFAIRKGRPNSQNLKFTNAFGYGARFITPGG